MSEGSSVVELMDDVSPKEPDHSVRSVAESAPRLLPEVAAVWVKILWRGLDHVAGWEMGNELFWAKGQEQSGFLKTQQFVVCRSGLSHTWNHVCFKGRYSVSSHWNYQHHRNNQACLYYLTFIVFAYVWVKYAGLLQTQIKANWPAAKSDVSSESKWKCLATHGNSTSSHVILYLLCNTLTEESFINNLL